MERKVSYIPLNPAAVGMLEYWRHFSGGTFFPINRQALEQKVFNRYTSVNKQASKTSVVTQARKHEKLKVGKTLSQQTPTNRASPRRQLSDKVAFGIPGSFPTRPLRKVLL